MHSKISLQTLFLSLCHEIVSVLSIQTKISKLKFPVPPFFVFASSCSLANVNDFKAQVPKSFGLNPWKENLFYEQNWNSNGKLMVLLELFHC